MKRFMQFAVVAVACVAILIGLSTLVHSEAGACPDWTCETALEYMCYENPCQSPAWFNYWEVLDCDRGNPDSPC
jgi:hypothetical protein